MASPALSLTSQLQGPLTDIDHVIERITIYNDPPNREELLKFLTTLRRDIDNADTEWGAEFIHKDQAQETADALAATIEDKERLEKQIEKVKELL